MPVGRRTLHYPDAEDCAEDHHWSDSTIRRPVNSCRGGVEQPGGPCRAGFIVGRSRKRQLGRNARHRRRACRLRHGRPVGVRGTGSRVVGMPPVRDDNGSLLVSSSAAESAQSPSAIPLQSASLRRPLREVFRPGRAALDCQDLGTVPYVFGRTLTSIITGRIPPAVDMHPSPQSSPIHLPRQPGFAALIVHLFARSARYSPSGSCRPRSSARWNAATVCSEMPPPAAAGVPLESRDHASSGSAGLPVPVADWVVNEGFCASDCHLF